MIPQLYMFVVLLLLQLASIHVTGESCPHPEDISPCKCTYVGSSSNINVECVRANVSDVATAFSAFGGKTIEKVLFRSLRNGRLPSLLFWNVKVKELIIADSNVLQGIADTDRSPAFVGLESSLERFYVSNSFNQRGTILTSVNLAHLYSLKELDFYLSDIPEIGDEWFANGPANLNKLEINACGTRKLGNSAFAHLNLEYLGILNSPLRYFKRTMLPRPAQRLHTLRICNAELANPPEDLFEEMPKLNGLYLDFNSIRRLPSKPFSTVWEKLTEFELGANPLECDGHMNWLFNLKRPEKLNGWCVAPVNKTLTSFIDSSKKTYF